MKLNDFARGCAIVARVEGEDHCVRAEHDTVWIGTPSTSVGRLTKEELLELKSLGWIIDRDADGWRARP